MLEAKNVVILSGGLVDTPEIVGNDSVARLRLAVDWAGNEKDSDNKSGYFAVKYFLNGDTPNAKFVKSQIEQGNFKKGSQISILGRVSQERWKDKATGDNRQQVVIVAESINYSSSGRREDAAAAGNEVGVPAGVGVPDTF